MISVLIADDHRVVRAGIAAIVKLQPDMRVAGEAADGESAIAAYRGLRPDVVTLDLKMPGLSGWQAISALRREFPDCKILVLTTLTGDEDIFRAVQAGALGYLLKDSSEEELAAGIRNTHAGRRTIPAEVSRVLDRRLSFDPLTAREIDVLRLVAQGMSNRELGVVLGLTENTVKGYLKNILSKLDAPDRTAAALLAVQRGLIELP